MAIECKPSNSPSHESSSDTSNDEENDLSYNELFDAFSLSNYDFGKVIKKNKS